MVTGDNRDKIRVVIVTDHKNTFDDKDKIVKEEYKSIVSVK
jgi:hypothetical protein